MVIKYLEIFKPVSLFYPDTLFCFENRIMKNSHDFTKSSLSFISLSKFSLQSGSIIWKSGGKFALKTYDERKEKKIHTFFCKLHILLSGWV